jgi:two-component system, NtrC family, sensor kinase
MKIAVIGGGRRCRTFLEMLDAQRFPNLQAHIVAVADIDDHAAGMRLAREKGIYTTNDYHDFFHIEELDLVIELTGQEDLLKDFLQNYPAKVRVLEATISKLFSDLIQFQEDYHNSKRDLQFAESVVKVIFSSIQDRVMMLGPDFKIVDANDAFLNSVGMLRKDVIGKYCYHVSHSSIAPCTGEQHPCPLRQALDSRTSAHSIHEHVDHEGRTWYCEVSIVPLKNEQGEMVLFLEITRDITDELEQRVRQNTRMLTRNLTRLIHEDKMIALGKLVASAVHEINNPLSGIHALARLVHKMLEEVSLSEEEIDQCKYYLRLIDTESARCSGIVSNLLSFSRQQKMEECAFQLNDLVGKVISLCGHKLHLQGIRLRTELDGGLPLMQGDPGQIQQCLVNLFFNAMEAMNDGGQLTIRTHWERSQNLIRLEVEDSGVGIPHELHSRIFEPFFTTRPQGKGVGLGLSVVYGIIKQHLGTIEVVSEPGKGSNFIITFFVMSPSGDSPPMPGE